MEPQRFRLVGTGVAFPATRLESDSLDVELGQPLGALQSACGVRSRYVCRGEAQDELAARAAQHALSNAGLVADDIDLVIFAAAVSKQPIPSTAPLVARHIGIAPGACTAFDVNSTCLSFLSGLDVATSMLATGRFRGVLIASAEIATRALPWTTDPATAGLFGDGAAAVVLTPPSATSTASCLRAAHFETYHEGYELCQLAAGGTGIDFHGEPERFRANATFSMHGHDLFKLTARHFPGFVDRLLTRAGWCQRDVDLVIPHQASPLALAHLAKRCGFSRDKIIDIVADYGNQVAASIPTALHTACAAGRCAAGSKILLLGTSAGISFGGMAVEI